jgi:hypothetical protein
MGLKFKTLELRPFNMATLNPFKSRDKYFLACKIMTLLICLPWPFTLVATLMSLAGEFSPNTSFVVRFLVRGAWLLLAVYPVVFFALVFLAERILAAKSYALAAAVALLPTALGVLAILYVFVF